MSMPPSSGRTSITLSRRLAVDADARQDPQLPLVGTGRRGKVSHGRLPASTATTIGSREVRQACLPTTKLRRPDPLRAEGSPQNRQRLQVVHNQLPGLFGDFRGTRDYTRTPTLGGKNACAAAWQLSKTGRASPRLHQPLKLKANPPLDSPSRGATWAASTEAAWMETGPVRSLGTFTDSTGFRPFAKKNPEEPPPAHITTPRRLLRTVLQSPTRRPHGLLFGMGPLLDSPSSNWPTTHKCLTMAFPDGT